MFGATAWDPSLVIPVNVCLSCYVAYINNRNI